MAFKKDKRAPSADERRSLRPSRLRLRARALRRSDRDSDADPARPGQNQDRYRELFERAPIGYLHLDADGAIVEANAEATSILGSSKGAVVGRALNGFMSTVDAACFDVHLAELLAGRGPVHCELGLLAEEGEPIPVRMEGTADDKGDPSEIRCRWALVDLSELKDAQTALEESEQRLQDLAERIDAVFYIHDEQGTIAYVNPAYEAIWGHGTSELYKKGDAWLDSVHPDDAPRVRGAFDELLRGGEFDEEYRVVRPDGEVRWVLDRAAPLSEDAEAREIAGLVYDITERREAEAALRHAQKMEAIGTLASGIAHDFNNVLQAILGSAEAGSQPGISDARRDAYLGRIRTVAKRGGALAKRLLVFGRAHEPELEAIRIDQAVASSADLLRRLSSEDIHFDIFLGAPGAAILIDPVELEHILLNLVSNARDAMPTGGVLTIRTEVARLDAVEAQRHHPLATPGEYVRLCVRDTGFGMDEETRGRVFEPFFTTKGPGRGTGLGLSTVFAIIERSGGHIDVQSTVGEGTSIALCFPRAKRDPVTKEATRARPYPLRGTALLVEDDPDIRASLRGWLDDLGLLVLAAEGFEEALKIRDRGDPIDVVVTDVRLPKMQGPALVTQIRAVHPDVRVLYVSADPRADLLDAGIIDSEDDVLQKPFDREDLASRLEPLCRQSLDDQWASRQTIAIVEDNRAARLALRDLLLERGYRVLAFSKPSELIDATRGCPSRITLLVSDLCLPEMEGGELVQRLRVANPTLPVVFMSGRAEPPAIEHAYFLQKPINIDDLVTRIEAALR